MLNLVNVFELVPANNAEAVKCFSSEWSDPLP